jgi:hypothetical protein
MIEPSLLITAGRNNDLKRVAPDGPEDLRGLKD